MRIAFVGGNGHHYLRGFISNPGEHEVRVGSCGDGVDDAAAKRWAEANKSQWFDSFDQLCETLKPDVVSVGAVYGRNGEWVAKALERNLLVVVQMRIDCPDKFSSFVAVAHLSEIKPPPIGKEEL